MTEAAQILYRNKKFWHRLVLLLQLEQDPHIHSDSAMPASALVRGGLFVAGLAVGAGATTLVVRRTPAGVAAPPPPRPAQPVADERGVGLVGQGSSQGPSGALPLGQQVVGPTSGMASVSSEASKHANEVFKYGFPGAILWINCRGMERTDAQV